MKDSSDNDFPRDIFTPEENGAEFIGLAVLALPVAMNIFGCRLLQLTVERDLKLATVGFQRGWTYDQNMAVAIFKVSDWKTAAGCLRTTLAGLKLLGVSGIYRYDFAESYWRRLHGTWSGDFQTVIENLTPDFQAAQKATLDALLKLMENHLAKTQEPPDTES